MSSRNPTTFRIWNTVVRAVVAVIGLLIIRAVILRLPMLQDVRPFSTTLSLADFLALAALTAIFVVVYLFGRQLSELCASSSRSTSVFGQLAEYLLALLVVVLGYHAYRELGNELLASEHWVYPTVFMILGVLPLIGIVAVVSRNLDSLTAWIVAMFSGRSERATQCAKCGGGIPSSASFCPSCGAQPPAPKPPVGNACTKCGSSLKPGAKFCPHCGTPSSEREEGGEATAPSCVHCGTQLKTGAKFCSECGKPQQTEESEPQLVATSSEQPQPLRRCSHCSAELKATAKFCPSCGRQVS